MATATPEAHSRRLDWAYYLPFLDWMRHYRRQDLVGDLIAGLVVAVMLVPPEHMAYALLVGLPLGTSHPQIAIVGRVEESEHFRNVSRFRVITYPQILAVRVDESLYFANTRDLENTLLRVTADHPDVKHLVLIGSDINYIDATA